MDINITGNPGTGNTFVEVKVTDGGIYQNLPNVTTVTNTTNIYGNGKKGDAAPADDKEKEIIRNAVLEYVGKLKCYVKPEWVNKYDTLWVKILALKEVEEEIYNKGRQKNTVFNRDFVGKIINVICKQVYTTENRTEMCMALEGKDGKVRKTMNQDPSDEVKKAVMKLLVEG